MKSSDIALIVCVSIVSIVGSFMFGNWIMNQGDASVEEVTFLQSETGEIVSPDQDYFNAYAYNPTVEIFIGNCGAANVEYWDPELGRCIPVKKEDEHKNEATDNNGGQEGDKKGNGENGGNNEGNNEGNKTDGNH